MSDTGVHSNEVHELGNKTLADAHLQEAYRSSTLRLYRHRLEAIAEVPGWERLRERAQELKRQVMEHLDFTSGSLPTTWKGAAARCTGPPQPRTPAG